MIEAAINRADHPALNGETSRRAGRNSLQWQHNDRMGGKVPVWAPPETAKANIAQTLAHAAHPETEDDFQSALSYAARPEPDNHTDDEFGFGDLIDMINPLHHIPLVGHVYREITGDEIKPISRIVGGALFGGFAGAATGVAETIIRYETGKDVAGNVMALATRGETPEFRSAQTDHPEKRLDRAARAAKTSPVQDLPGTALSFADLGNGRRAVYERVPAADGRTAGSMIRRYEDIAPPQTPRSPVSTLEFTPFSALKDGQDDLIGGYHQGRGSETF